MQFKMFRYKVMPVLILILVLSFAQACGGTETQTRAPAPYVAPTAVPAVAATAVPAATAAKPKAITADTGPDYGGILRYAHRLDADTFDPHHNTTAYNYNEMHTFFEALVKVDSDGNFLPSLATSWEIAEDGKDIIFDLRKGVKFGDGTDFNAAAVKYNYDRIMDPDTISPQRGYIVPPLTAVKVLDDHKVRFQVDKPFRPLMGILIDRPGWIASPTAIEKYGEDFGRNPVSTGPYEFVEWSPGQRVVYKKNPNYWGEGLPYLDGILWLDVPDVTIQIAMVRTDEIDMTDREIRNADLATIRRNPNLKISEFKSGRMFGLNFNFGIKPFDNKDLRQAVAYAIDRERFIDIVMMGAARPAYALRGGGWDYDPDFTVLEYDQDKARQKLIDAGYPNGVDIPFASMSTLNELFMTETYQAILAEVGINLQVEQYPPKQFWSYEVGRGGLATTGFARTSWSLRADPHLQMMLAYHSTGKWGGIANYKNAEVDRLIEEGMSIYDIPKAKKMYSEINRLIGEDVLMPAVYHPTQFIAMHNRVQNFHWVPDSQLRLQFLWLKQD